MSDSGQSGDLGGDLANEASNGAGGDNGDRRRLLITVAGGAVLLLAVVGGAAMWLGGGDDAAEAPASAEAGTEAAAADEGNQADGVAAGGEGTGEQPEPAVAAVPEGTPPEAQLHAQVGKAHPQAAKWLTLDDLPGRVVATVVAVADGKSPRGPLAFMAPKGAFHVTGGKRKRMSGKSGSRYNRVARALGALPAAEVVGLLHYWLPALEASYQEIRRSDAPPTFLGALRQALDHMIATPLHSGPFGVVSAKGALYAFRNPTLEGASAAQKHLLRMGPKNARTLVAKLREVRGLLVDG